MPAFGCARAQLSVLAVCACPQLSAVLGRHQLRSQSAATGAASVPLSLLNPISQYCQKSNEEYYVKTDKPKPPVKKQSLFRASPVRRP